MAALRVHAVGLLLILMQVEAVAPWNSTDMQHKLAADTKDQAQKLSDLNDAKATSWHVDSMLSGNKTILNISSEQLNKAKQGDITLAKEIRGTKDELQQAKKDELKKQTVQEESAKKVKETGDALAKANAVVSEANANVAEKRKAYNTAKAKKEEADDNLQTTVINNPQGVAAANRNLQIKIDELASADKALSEATKHQAATAKAQESAKTAANTAFNDRSKATKDYQDAAGRVQALQKGLDGLTDKNAGPEQVIDRITDSVEKQEAIVNSIEKQSKELHEEVAAKTKAHEDISATVNKDTECVAHLWQDEANLNASTGRFKLTLDAYEAATGDAQKQLLGAAWTLKEKAISDTNALIQDQKDCAPKGITIPPQVDLPKCPAETGGGCYIFPCHPWRHAICENSKCVCGPGTCVNAEGACVSRPSPVFLESQPTELPAEPAVATTVFLAAAALVMTVFLVVRRRRASEIHMSENALG